MKNALMFITVMIIGLSTAFGLMMGTAHMMNKAKPGIDAWAKEVVESGRF